MSLRFSPAIPFMTRTTTTSNRNSTKPMVQAFAGTAAMPSLETRKSKNLYQVLRLQQSASATEIKTAYRNLAKRFHPDVASSETSGNFIEIQKAYETLYDPSSRERYDASISETRFAYKGGVVSSTSGGQRTRRWETDQCW